jgi:hypothetical protein
MTQLTWDAVGQRYFEAGVDRGVLYPVGKPGVAWNGLTNVTENPGGGDPTPYYIDGLKYVNVPTAEEFRAKLEAYTYPDEFALCDGTSYEGDGLSFGLQGRQQFGLSYRTRMGNDILGQEFGYKIHLIYNALASPSQRNNSTVGDSVDVGTFSWDLTALPIPFPGRRPTAHITIDSTKTNPALLKILEVYLYGSTNVAPRQLTPMQLSLLFSKWKSLGLTVNFLGIGQGTSQFVVNYAPQPSFESSGTTVEVRRNFYKNPQFETLGATFGVRRNLVLNGDVSVNTSNWVSGAALTRQQVGGKWWMNAPVGTYTYATSVGVVGRFYAMSFRVRGPVGATIEMTSTDNQVGDVGQKSTVVIPASGEIVVKMPSARAVSGTNLHFGLVPTVSGFMLTDMLMEEVAGIGDTPAGAFFNGNTPNTTDVSHVWDGVANASSTLQYGNSPKGLLTGYDGGSYVISSTLWKESGARSVRIMPRRPASYMYMWAVADLGLTVGKKYTVVVTQRQDAVQTGTLDASARSIYWQQNGVKSNVVTGPNAIGQRVLRTTFTVGQEGLIVFFNGSANEDMWYDSLTIVEGEYYGYQFDGSTPVIGDFTHSWVGAAQDSASIMTAPGVLGITSGFAEGQAILSSEWSSSGTKSLRITKKASALTWSGVYNRVSAPLVSLIKGATYTVSAKVRITKVQAAPYAIARQMRIETTVPINSPQAPNAVGVYQIDWTFVAAETGNFVLQFWNGGGITDDDVWWDSYIFVEGATPVAYFDGSSSPFLYQNQIVSATWAGTANNSTSSFKYFPGLPLTANPGDGYIIDENLLVYVNDHWTNYGSVLNGLT